MLVRHADPDRDAAACAAIYAPYVRDTTVSFELRAPSAAEMRALIADTATRHPWLVAEDDDGRLAGYAYASPHRVRAAYRWSVDVAIYVDPRCHRRGAGRRLYTALFELLRRQGLRIACAGVTLPNDPSLALHRALGFEHVGTYRAIGWKAGAWRDVAWWQLDLRPARDDDDDGRPPPEPGPPQRL